MSSRGETREQPSIPEPAQLGTEHVGLAVTIVALTIAGGALVVEHVTHLELLRKGAYSILAALAVVGVVSYFGVRILRELTGLRSGQVVVREALRQRQAAEREVREPVGAGRVQAGTATGGLLESPDAARAQWYVEGYVDGITRRGDEDDPSPS